MAKSTTLNTLEYLLRRRHASRVEISRRLDLSRAALSGVVNQLISENLVQESGIGDSNGGKPPVMLEINPQAFTVAAIDIGSTKLLRGMLCDASGQCLKTLESPYNPDLIIDEVCSFAKKLIGRKSVSAMAVALSGIVNIEQNTVVESANFPLAQSGIAKKLADKLNIPVILGNRSRLAAEFEGIFGSACGKDNYIYVSLGKSVGSAVCFNDTLFDGTSGAAGEIRNFPCYYGGETLSLEKLLSESNLLSRTKSTSIEEMAEKWDNGDADALDEMNKLIDVLASIFSFLCDFTDIPLLIPGGRFRRFGKTFHTRFTERFNTDQKENNRSRRVIFPDSGEDAPLYGAAVSAIRHTFNNLKPNKKGLEK